MTYSQNWRLLLRRLENMNLQNRLKRYPRRKMLVVVTFIFVLIYLFTRRSSSPSNNATFRSKKCINERLKQWNQAIADFDIGIDNSSVNFIGNGFIGIDERGQLRLADSVKNYLSVASDFYPIVEIRPENGNMDTLRLTDFKNGLSRTVSCFSLDGECACTVSTIFAHRKNPSLILQNVEISNPTRSTLRVNLSRPKSTLWRRNENNDAYIHTRTIGNQEYSIICSNLPEKMSINRKTEETVKFICAINADANSMKSKNGAINVFKNAKTSNNLMVEHIDGWHKINKYHFSIEQSKAPNTLNGDRVNATKYILLSSVRAPTIEHDVNASYVEEIEAIGRKNELCYTGHSNLLYPSRLWTDWNTWNDIEDIVKSWMLTFEKRGCGNVIKTGALGISQSFVQSLGALSYHNSHLEMAMDANDLHREMVFGGIPMQTSLATIGSIDLKIRVDEENRPYFVISSTTQLYACDGGCLDDPVTLGKLGTRIPVKVTKPATSLLYVATNRKHLELLKSAIHVAEVGSAPAHEEELMELHRSGGAGTGLPTSFWILLLIVIILFHLFLAKIFWSEWRKGDMTPYNPYLRNRYSLRSH